MRFGFIAPRRLVRFDNRSEGLPGRLANREQFCGGGKGVWYDNVRARRRFIGPQYGPTSNREIDCFE